MPNATEGFKGCLPRTTEVGDGTFKVFGEPGTAPLVPPTEWEKWKDTSFRSHVWHIIDQASQNSCCGCGGCGVMMTYRESRDLPRIVFSQASIYGLEYADLTPRRYDNGMAIDTCLEILRRIGVCSVDVIDQYDWAGFRRGRWPDDWKEHAKQNRIVEAWDCPTREHVVSAIIRGFPVLYGAKGHAVYRIARGLDGNSWGRDWGENGIGQWATDRELEREIARYGAWAVRVVSHSAETPT